MILIRDSDYPPPGSSASVALAHAPETFGWTGPSSAKSPSLIDQNRDSKPASLFARKRSMVYLSTRHSPIIVGERYELAETVASTYGGDHPEDLLVKPDFQTALLSRPGYEKYGSAEVTKAYVKLKPAAWSPLAEYNVSRSTQDPMYLSYTQSGLSQPQAQTAPASYDRHSDQMSYGISPLYQSRGDYDSTRTQIDFGLRRALEVKSYSPSQGGQGTHVYVYIKSAHDLFTPPPLAFSIMFANRRVSASLTRLETVGPSFEYVVTADAPQYSEIGSTVSLVQLRLQLQEDSGQDAGLVQVGYFEYPPSQLESPPQATTRKRKLSADLNGSVANGNVPQDSRNFDAYSFASYANPAYPQSLHTIDLDSMQRRFTPYGRAQNPRRFQETSSRRGLQNVPNAILPSQSLMKAPASQASAWNPSYSSIASGRTLSISSNHAQAIAQMSSPDTSNPTLVRTSTLQQTDSPGPVLTPSSSGVFNPYSIYPQKAVLKIRGNLDSMTDGWTPEEWAAKRRLVQFWRAQNKSTINADFAPVTPEDRQPNSICISCIWWEERQECFATSVDTIYLLEQLVALRFTVEEKNRIRRNLEGFHPLTVSKAKPDSEEFFKTIMGFPNPKPRNIEKDVKVFPWKILAQSLKKIISKYSASYSSAAGNLHTPRSSIFNGFQSDQGADPYAKNIGSRSASDSTVSSTYAPTLKSNTMSPSGSMGRSSQYSEAPLSGSIPSLDYDVPQVPNQYASQDQESYMTQSSVPGLTQSYTAPASHTSQRPESREAYDSPRHFKRPRANTSAGSYYSSQTDDSHSSLMGHTSRSFSEQPTPRMSLPSLTESYNLSSPEQRYLTPQEPSATRTTYDLASYLDANSTGANQAQAQEMSYQQSSEENATS